MPNGGTQHEINAVSENRMKLGDDKPALPSIGRIVHMVDIDGQNSCRAAIVTHVYDDASVDLVVFNRWGESAVRHERRYYSDSKQPFTWHWPERA